jgi:hypothetical protein
VPPPPTPARIRFAFPAIPGAFFHVGLVRRVDGVS